MIEISKNGPNEVCVSVGTSGKWKFYFSYHVGQEWPADLLLDRLHNDLGDRIEAVRREEYERGWADAKAKKRGKRDWFFRTLTLRSE